MKRLTLTGKQLISLGFPQGPVISIAIRVIQNHFFENQRQQALSFLKDIAAHPEQYTGDQDFNKVAEQLIPPPLPLNTYELNTTGIDYSVFGMEHIEEGALQQMQVASRLPVAVAGALMPDAHQGYGLPIGGVLAVENAVIPYGVGVDIGCRMCLSVFDIPANELSEKESFFKRELNEATLFGAGKQFETMQDHEVLDRSEFREIPLLRSLHTRAALQIGSSGSGNHFVEFGKVEIPDADPVLGIPAGTYLGLLSHSGSRGLGANIANHYTNVAREKRKLPTEAAHLAWLNLDEEHGIEYWQAMNLAGDYASANHHIIHEKIARQLGRQPVKMVENHHNFAWKEVHDGRNVIVHRKGATPAGRNVLGIIPGSMTAPGFIVKGKGNNSSLSSASHGAGRQMSRSAALKKISPEALQQELAKHGVSLIGGGLDEAPHAYKDIRLVMDSQKSLVDIAGIFTPKIVKMDDAKPRDRRSGKGRK